jgi:hypothetical protein
MANRVISMSAAMSIALLLLGLFPGIGGAAEPLQPAKQPDLPSSSVLTDIALGEGGALQGHVVDSAGKPLAAKTVILLHQGVEVARATTDRQGQFTILDVRGGPHQLTTDQQSLFLRAWTQEAAPPVAQSLVVLSRQPVVRGQNTIGGFNLPSIHPGRYLNHPATIGGLIGAGIIVPTAMYRGTLIPPFQNRTST